MKFNKYLIFLLPAALVLGPFLADGIVVLVSLNFIYESLKKKLINCYKNIFTYYFLFFYIIINISSLFSSNIIYSLKSSIPYVRYYFFIIAFSYIVKNDKLFLNFFFKILIITLSIVSLSGYIEYFFNYSFSLDPKFVKLSYRLSGFFGSELILGSYVARLLPLLVLLALYLKKNNLFFAFILLFNFFIIFLSGERTALFLGLITFMSYVFFSSNKISIKFILLISFIILSVISVSTDNALQKRIFKETKNQIYNKNQLNFFSKEHTSHYKSAIKMFLDKPLLGHGPRSFRIICKKPEFYENIHSCTTHPHNFLLQLLSEVGIFGGTSLIAIFFYCLFFFFKSLSLNFFTNPFYYIPIIIFSIPFVPSGNFFNNWLSIISYTSMSLSIYILFIKNEKNKNSTYL